MQSYLNMIMNLHKEIIRLKNRRAHVCNPNQRAKIAQLISELETFLKILEEKIQPLLDEIGSPLKDMVLDSYLKGIPFSVGVQLHQLERDVNNARIRLTKKAEETGKAFKDDDIQKSIEEKYRKQLYRALDYFETH